MMFFLIFILFVTISVTVCFFLEDVSDKKKEKIKNLKDALSLCISQEIGSHRAKDCFEIIQNLNYFYFYKNLKLFYISSGDKIYILSGSPETHYFFKSMVISLGVKFVVTENDLPIWCFSCDSITESQRLKLFDSINDLEKFNDFLTNNLQNSFLYDFQNYYVDIEFQISKMFILVLRNKKTKESNESITFKLNWIDTSVYVYIEEFKEYLTYENLDLCNQIRKKSVSLKNNIINCSLKYCDLIK